MLGANPPTKVITGFINRIWKVSRIDNISFLPNGVFIVRFRTVDEQQAVPNGGFVMFVNKPMVVKPSR